MTRRVLYLLLLLLPLTACGRNLPSAPELPTLEAMRPHLTARLTPEEAERVLGTPDEITGSGLRIYVYRIEHRHRVLLGFPGSAPLVYAKLQAPDGQFTDLPLED